MVYVPHDVIIFFAGMDLGVQYSRTKQAVGFNFWSIDETPAGLMLTLNGEPIDLVLMSKPVYSLLYRRK